MKEVRKFLKKNQPIDVEVLGAHGEHSWGYMLSNRLGVLGPKKDILYLLSYVDGYNVSRFIPSKHVVILDDLFKIDEVIEHVFEPTRFMEELTHIPEARIHDWYRIWIDGELVFSTQSVRKCNNARDSYLRERKIGKVDFKHMKMLDPAGNRTDFTF